jgi:predicted signal transduction protein with EAL and GGDEF domain
MPRTSAMSSACPCDEDCGASPAIARSSRSDCLRLLATVINHAHGGVRGTAVFLLDCDDLAGEPTHAADGHLGDTVVAAAVRNIRSASPAWHRLLRGERGEFIVIAQGLVDGATVLGTAARLVHAFDDALQGWRLPIAAEVSVGIAFAPAHGATAEALLAAAESGLRDAMRAARCGQRQKRRAIPPPGSGD